MTLDTQYKFRYTDSMIHIVRVIVISFLLLSASQASGSRIIATVNDVVITNVDVDQRIRILDTLLKEETEKQELLKKEILNRLIDDILIAHKLEIFNIQVSDDEKTTLLQNIANNAETTPEALKETLYKASVTDDAIDDFLQAEILRQQAIQGLVMSSISISQQDKDNAINQIMENHGQLEFELQEIFLSFNNQEQMEEAEDVANNIAQKATTSTEFSTLARLLSASAAAGNGGNIGWVRESQLNTTTINILRSTGNNAVTVPIKRYNGFVIYFIKDIRPTPSINIADPQQYRQLEQYVENQIRYTRLEQEAKKFLADLRLDAAIELRTYDE